MPRLSLADPQGWRMPQPLPNIHPKAPRLQAVPGGPALPPHHFPGGFGSPAPSVPPFRALPAAVGSPLSQVGPAGLSPPPGPGSPQPWGPSEPDPGVGEVCWEPGRGHPALRPHTAVHRASRGVTGQNPPFLAAFPETSSITFRNKSYKMYLRQELVLSDLFSRHGTETFPGSFAKL